MFDETGHLVVCPVRSVAQGIRYYCEISGIIVREIGNIAERIRYTRGLTKCIVSKCCAAAERLLDCGEIATGIVVEARAVL